MARRVFKDRQAAKVALREAMADAEENVSLNMLARHLGISPTYVYMLFAEICGDLGLDAKGNG